MCPRNPLHYTTYRCGHKLPEGWCEYFSRSLDMCLGPDSDPSAPPKFQWRRMVDLQNAWGDCWFCETGKDIGPGGDYEYGARWADRGRFR